MELPAVTKIRGRYYMDSEAFCAYRNILAGRRDEASRPSYPGQLIRLTDVARALGLAYRTVLRAAKAKVSA